MIRLHSMIRLEQKLISGRFYGGSVKGDFSLSAVVQPGASIIRFTVGIKLD